MTLAYFDTSALVKLFLVEPGSLTVRSAWKLADTAAAGRITYAETRAALAAANRRPEKRFNNQSHLKAKSYLEQIWPKIFQVNITDTIVQAAGNLAETYGLRGYDAVHLACAIHLGANALVCADIALINAAQKQGLDVIDARVDPPTATDA